MARQVTSTVYTFAELAPDVQERVLNEYRDINIHEDWADPLVKNFKETLESLGFLSPTIYWSGFHSQGDGACFTTDQVDIARYIKAHNQMNKYTHLYILVTAFDDAWTKISISQRGMYVHQDTMYLDAHDYRYHGDDTDFRRKIAYEFVEFCDDVLERARELAVDFYLKLEEEYEYLTSEEAVKEAINANEYEFYADGKLYG